MDNATLERIRGPLPTRRMNARSTAALLDNPGCVRRSVLDAAQVDLYKLGQILGMPVSYGQSPFALGQGNRFEKRIKDNDYKLLVEVLGGIGVDLPTTTLRSVKVTGAKNQAGLDQRVEQTREILADIACGSTSAPNVIDHGVTRLDVGGSYVYLEQDAMAFRDGDKLRICEVKGFPIVDGSAEPNKVGAAARQSAVYVASIQDTLVEMGLDPDIVSTNVALICPKNYTIAPTASEMDAARDLRALRRQLDRRRAAPTFTPAEFAALGTAMAANPDARRKDDDSLTGHAIALVESLEMRYEPSCLSGCDLARYCRQEAADRYLPELLGNPVSGLLAGLGDLRQATLLADGAQPAPEHQEIADELRRARASIDQCLAMVVQQ